MSDTDSPRPKSSRVGRKLVVNGQAVTVRLEPLWWEYLDDVCRRQGQSADEVVSEIAGRCGDTGLVLAIHIFISRYFQDAADRDRPYRSLSEPAAGDSDLSPTLQASLDAIGPRRKK